MIQSTLRKENDMSKVTEEVYFRLENKQSTSLEEWNKHLRWNSVKQTQVQMLSCDHTQVITQLLHFSISLTKNENKSKEINIKPFIEKFDSNRPGMDIWIFF